MFLLAKQLPALFDWRLFALLVVNFPAYCLLGRIAYGSFQAFFDAFPYVHTEVTNARQGISTSDATIVQPHYPGRRPQLLFALTVIYFGVVAAQYVTVRWLFGPLTMLG
jgi:hypothetical protein